MVEIRRTDRLRKLLQRRGARRRWEAIFALIVVLFAAAIPLLVVPKAVRWWQARRDALEAANHEVAKPPAIEFPNRPSQPLTIHLDRWIEIGLTLGEVIAAPPTPPLRMDGVLYLDPDDFSLVRSRFQGEVVEMPMVGDDTKKLRTNETTLSPLEHTLRFGDEVKQGQLLAVVWSRELGEKKSELSDALSTLAFDRDTLKRMSSNEAAVPINSIREAERRVRASEIAVERIEKTLSAWQLSTAEIQQLRKEIQSQKSSSADGKQELAHASVDQWARVEIRSPIDGTIVEKNVTIGALVDMDDALFKIANLNHLDVRGFAYEEDLATLQRLAPENRRWTIQVKGDTLSKPIDGVFDRIGSLIDPLQHTGLVMGWVDNSDRSLRAGQFVTAAVALPESQSLVSVPAQAVVDVDGNTYVLLQQPKEDQFLPVQVHVVRFQDGVACIDPKGSVDCQNCLVKGMHVVVNGAVEIMAEYQSHLDSGIEVQTASATSNSTSSGDAS